MMVSKEVMQLIDRIILDYEIKDYKSVPDDYKTELTIMMLQNDGIDALDFLGCSDPENVINSLIKYMITGDPCRALDLAATIEKGAIECYAIQLEEAFEEQVDQADIEEKKSRGLTSRIDPINGEVIWD
jgi:hypothetical protein